MLTNKNEGNGYIKDAGEILVYIYNHFLQKVENIPRKKIEAETGWEISRIDNALNYLDKNRFAEKGKDIKIQPNLGHFETRRVEIDEIIRLTGKGISIVENSQKFKLRFGFEIGDPRVFEYSW
jgi:hypothetical protein